MSKLIYITEAQYKKLVEDGPYLKVDDTTNPYKYGGPEVTVDGVTGNDVDDDVELGVPTTTDEFANQLSRRGIRGLGRAVYTEANQEIKNNNLGLTNKSKQTANQLGLNASDIDCNYGFVIQDRIENGNYNGKVGDEDLTQLKNDIHKKLQTQMNISRSGRQAKMARGENVLKSAPKTGAKGGAHTPSGNNTIGVSYK